MRPYNGPPSVKQLACTKENYKGKNMSGGRKAVFSQGREYRKGWGHALRWSHIRTEEDFQYEQPSS